MKDHQDLLDLQVQLVNVDPQVLLDQVAPLEFLVLQVHLGLQEKREAMVKVE